MTVLPAESHVRLLHVSEWWEICDVTTWGVGRERCILLSGEWSDKEKPRGNRSACLESGAPSGRDTVLTDNKAISVSFPCWFQLFHKEERGGSEDPRLSYPGGFSGLPKTHSVWFSNSFLNLYHMPSSGRGFSFPAGASHKVLLLRAVTFRSIL